MGGACPAPGDIPIQRGEDWATVGSNVAGSDVAFAPRAQTLVDGGHAARTSVQAGRADFSGRLP
eukprot:1527603-Lingulodinium_polyedra.AAC.1